MQWTFVKESRALTSSNTSVCTDAMKWLVFLFAPRSSALVHDSGQPARFLQPGAGTGRNAAGHKNNDRHDQAQHRDRGRAVALLSRAIAVSRTAGLP